MEFAEAKDGDEARLAISKAVAAQGPHAQFANAVIQVVDANGAGENSSYFCERQPNAGLPQIPVVKPAAVRAMMVLDRIRQIGCVEQAELDQAACLPEAVECKPLENPAVMVVVRKSANEFACAEEIVQAIPELKVTDTMEGMKILFLE